MVKRLFIMAALIVSMSGVAAFMVPGTALAAGGACGAKPKPKLFGIFVPWYQYLELEEDAITEECLVKDFKILPGSGQSSSLPKVGLAVVDNLLRLAGVVAVIFVIVGGVQYATSQGEPDQANKARSTIIAALIGLVISMFAVAFVGYLARALTS